MDGQHLTKWFAACAMGVIAAGTMLATEHTAEAADHTDPPARTAAAPAEDIGDFYAWTRGTGADQTLVLVTTFGGLLAPGAGVKWDADVRYGMHIDNDGDLTPDVDLFVRFGQDPDTMAWGFQLHGLPGEAGPVVGAAGMTMEFGDADVWVGLRDDPFFFDLMGFTDTLTSGTLSFDSSRDSFAGTNIGVIIVELPVSAIKGAGDTIDLWATTAKYTE